MDPAWRSPPSDGLRSELPIRGLEDAIKHVWCEVASSVVQRYRLGRIIKLVANRMPDAYPDAMANRPELPPKDQDAGADEVQELTLRLGQRRRRRTGVLVLEVLGPAAPDGVLPP